MNTTTYYKSFYLKFPQFILSSTAISMEEGQPAVVTQEQIFENIHLHKEVLGSVKQQPLGMRRKLKIVHQVTYQSFLIT